MDLQVVKIFFVNSIESTFIIFVNTIGHFHFGKVFDNVSTGTKAKKL